MAGNKSHFLGLQATDKTNTKRATKKKKKKGTPRYTVIRPTTHTHTHTALFRSFYCCIPLHSKLE